ncbi:MAG: hypothetical protein CL910_02450 [Deltaproteobacteria bacterium]|jgi:hypothetical protein|nr:hypothetical protein [Deltaproteobacteria bacterium]
MAIRIPDPLKRRHLVEGELDAAKAVALADAYLEEGLVLDAVPFLEKAGAHERLEELLHEVIRSGNVFEVRAVAEALKKPLEAHHWEEVARAAREQGKDQYATEANAQVERLRS